MSPTPDASTSAESVRAAFHDRFGAEPVGLARAPGRVNLIGEHTDYNDGFVLPMAIDRRVHVAFAPRADGIVRAHSETFEETVTLAPGDLRPGAHSGWTAYLAGLIWSLRDAGLEDRGADLLIRSEVPAGAGLSSSAAFELAVARALFAAAGAGWHAVTAAILARRADNEYVGIASGIMDQFAAAAAVRGHALLLDCRTLEFETIPIPPELRIVVMDSGVRRRLTAEAYNERVARCRAVVAHIARDREDVLSLRDVDPELLDTYRDELDPESYRRARHVVAEIQRPLALAVAFRAGDHAAAGALIDASHRSLRELYEVSSAELDALTEAARAHPGCLGARLTGAGFGGCAIALVRREAVADFIARVRADYNARFDRPSSFRAVEPAAGAELVDAPQAR